MEKSFFGKMFSPSPKAQAAPAPLDYTDADVQFNLGLKFACGTGAAQDFAQAADWYRKAAAQNHGLAHFNLGVMYDRGQGVVQDAAQSAVWFGGAANLCDAAGQFKMGRSCERASMEGLPAEKLEARIEAYKWYQLAAAQGYTAADGAYATLTFKMTREDVAEANQRVANFVPRKAKPLLA